jgi:uncharacterized repeat protein (TIGR03803 family)
MEKIVSTGTRSPALLRLLGASAAFTLALLMLPATDALAASELQVLHRFKGSADGAQPIGALAADKNGNFYGVTCCSKSENPGPKDAPYGVVYRLSPPKPGETKWTKKTIYAFKSFADGYAPEATLVIDESSARIRLFGTTSGGGRTGENCTSGCGTVFRLTEPNGDGAWSKTILYKFKGGADGGSPVGKLAVDGEGALYGTTANGGLVTDLSSGNGTVFRVKETSGEVWIKNTLHSFAGAPTGGVRPAGDLVRDKDGVLYGTTTYGGSIGPMAFLGRGLVYRLVPPSGGGNVWAFGVVHYFQGGADGEEPRSGVLMDGANVLYGTTAKGGGAAACTNGCGTVFRLSTNDGIDWFKATIHSFTGNAQGQYPQGGLMRVGDSLFGSTFGLLGTLYRLDPPAVMGSPWTHGVLHAFEGPEGSNPDTTLLRVKGGFLYGLAAMGGDSPKCEDENGCGTIFRIKP